MPRDIYCTDGAPSSFSYDNIQPQPLKLSFLNQDLFGLLVVADIRKNREGEGERKEERSRKEKREKERERRGRKRRGEGSRRKRREERCDKEKERGERLVLKGSTT